jgi:hypothetical protein
MRALGFDVKKPDIIKMVHGAHVVIENVPNISAPRDFTSF